MFQRPRNLAAAAIACGVAGFALWVLSYSWVLFSLAAREPRSWQLVVILAEAGAILASVLCISFSVAGLRRSTLLSPQSRIARRGLILGVALLILILVPNLVGALWLVK
jgi:hypothetical protein